MRTNDQGTVLKSPSRNLPLSQAGRFRLAAAMGMLVGVASGSVYLISGGSYFFNIPLWASIVFFPGFLAGYLAYDHLHVSTLVAQLIGVVVLGVAYALIAAFVYWAANQIQRRFLNQARNRQQTHSGPSAAPPTADELVGVEGDRYHDAPCVLKHFLGLTQSEAFQMFRGRMHYLREDFVWMKPRGQLYYLPPLVEYLKTQGPEDGDIYDAASTLAIVITSKDSPPSREVKELIKEFARVMRQQVGNDSDWECELDTIERA